MIHDYASPASGRLTAQSIFCLQKSDQVDIVPGRQPNLASMRTGLPLCLIKITKLHIGGVRTAERKKKNVPDFGTPCSTTRIATRVPESSILRHNPAQFRQADIRAS
jgi:hypothetical protein